MTVGSAERHQSAELERPRGAEYVRVRSCVSEAQSACEVGSRRCVKRNSLVTFFKAADSALIVFACVGITSMCNVYGAFGIDKPTLAKNKAT